ncbi:MAG: DUF3572 domain-containing protein [Bauldia sp.]|nr:DUF3572 domain-containing protein [Bauldia sp.]
MTKDDAEAIGVAALTFIAADPERLTRFLSMTGLRPEDVRTAAADPDFFAGVLRHVAGWEPDLLAFAAEAGLAPADIRSAAIGLGAFEA